MSAISSELPIATNTNIDKFKEHYYERFYSGSESFIQLINFRENILKLREETYRFRVYEKIETFISSYDEYILKSQNSLEALKKEFVELSQCCIELYDGTFDNEAITKCQAVASKLPPLSLKLLSNSKSICESTFEVSSSLSRERCNWINQRRVVSQEHEQDYVPPRIEKQLAFLDKKIDELNSLNEKLQTIINIHLNNRDFWSIVYYQLSFSIPGDINTLRTYEKDSPQKIFREKVESIYISTQSILQLQSDIAFATQGS